MTPNNLSGFFDTEIVRNIVSSKPFIYSVYVAGVGILVSSSVLGYHWYSVHRAQTAQKAFSEDLAEYHNTITGQLGHQNWNMLASIFELGANAYSRTSLAPFYLSYEAETLLKDNRRTEATATMGRSVALTTQNNPLRSLYALKNTLMKLDEADTAQLSTTEAENELVALAYDTHNLQRDAALYYLGRYYWYKNNHQKAREALQELMTIQSATKNGTSPWVHEAETLLKQITA
jgi:predicted Zn-dependent protease